LPEVPDPAPKAPRRCADCGRRFIAGPYARWGPCCRWKRRGKPPKYVWTPERDAVLRERYDSRVRGRAAEIGAVLGGWPGWVVKKRARQLGLAYPRSPWQPWTPAEERFLEEHAGTRHLWWMAQKLGRTETGVALKLKRMKISRRWREGYTLRELELCFGVDHHAIERWIRAGQLVGRRRGTRRHGRGGRNGGPADAWFFTDADILSFIKEHPLVFRLDRVDQLWFMDLLLAGGIVRKALAAAAEDVA
jgi:hypothetical protein